MFSIIMSVLVFGALILIHELGHFLTAKMFNFKVLEFSIGMGPCFYSRQKGETKYSVRAFPIGGYVAVEGEDTESYDERALQFQPVWKRFIFVVAGAAMNLVLGLILVMFLVNRQPLLATNIIANFDKNAVSSQYLAPNDKIVKVNGYSTPSYNDVIFQIIRDQDGIVDFEVVRNDKRETINGVPFETEDIGQGQKAIKLDFMFYGKEKSFVGNLTYGVQWTVSMIKQVYYSVFDLITGKYGLNQLAGPVGTASAIGQASSQGLTSFLFLVSFLTINIGIFNLLPLPALDGGRLLFLIIEFVRGKPVDPKYENYIHTAGFLLLMALIVLVTYNDIARLITGG